MNYQKSLKTKTNLEQAFLKLLERRPINEITVRDVVNSCGMNRNTFYYYYKNLPDLLESVVKNLVDDILAKNSPSYTSLEDCFLAAISFARENKQIIKNIYHSSNRAIFERHLWHLCDYSVASFLGNFPLAPKNPEEFLAIKDFLKFECFGFAIDWLNHGMPDYVESRIRLLSNFWLPGPGSYRSVAFPTIRR